MCMYLVGMSLFSHIKYGMFLNEQANFDTFINAMLILFRYVCVCVFVCMCVCSYVCVFGCVCVCLQNCCCLLLLLFCFLISTIIIITIINSYCYSFCELVLLLIVLFSHIKCDPCSIKFSQIPYCVCVFNNNNNNK